VNDYFPDPQPDPQPDPESETWIVSHDGERMTVAEYQNREL
jgi:hypothetical protein